MRKSSIMPKLLASVTGRLADEYPAAKVFVLAFESADEDSVKLAGFEEVAEVRDDVFGVIAAAEQYALDSEIKA